MTPIQQLQLLEEDYLSIPPALRPKNDLEEINSLRKTLNLPPMDEPQKKEESQPKTSHKEHPPQKDNFTEERKLYSDYLKKMKILTPLRIYANQVARATSGGGMTPVKPLATMGINGGALLCDHCHKPIILEGGKYNNMPVDRAWRESNKDDDWRSWIHGGMVVEIQTNGTLRIYHGYQHGNRNHCCNIASKQDEEARKNHKSPKYNWKKLLSFLEKEKSNLSHDERMKLLNDILDLMTNYDPGIGVNHP